MISRSLDICDKKCNHRYKALLGEAARLSSRIIGKASSEGTLRIMLPACSRS